MAEQNRSLFGWQFTRKQPDTKPVSFTPDNEDGAFEISPTGGYFGQYMDLQGDKFQNDRELIMKYRTISQYPEVDLAVEDICNEAITVESGKILKLDLDKLEQSNKVKDLISMEFQKILALTNFRNNAYDIFKRWYVDGRLFFHVIIDPKKPGDGIKELRAIDPTKIRKIKETEKVRDPKTGAELIKEGPEYYLYQDESMYNSSEGLKINTDAIIQVNSGLLNENRDKVIGYLQKALKPLNQLSMMEDSLVIYRISRAPERRIFYIDVGNLPKGKAEEYLNNTMNRYRNKIVYDPTTGAIRDEKIKSNPSRLAMLPKVEKIVRHRPLNDADLSIIFANSGEWELYYAVLLHTGLRAGDAAMLTYDNIDFSRKIITTLVRKSRRVHEFPLSDYLISLISENKEGNNPLFPILFSTMKNNAGETVIDERVLH